MASALIAPAVTGVLLLVVVLAVARGIDWRSNEIFVAHEGEGSIVGRIAGHPVVWALVFLVLTLGITGVAIAAVGGFGISLPGGLTTAGAVFALLFVGYLVFGTYVAVRDRDVSPAGATLATALLVGTLLLVAVTAKLALGL